MGKHFNQRIKIALAIVLIVFSITMIKLIEGRRYLAEVKEQRAEDSIIKVKYGSKIYESKKKMQEKSNIIDSNETKTNECNNSITDDKNEIKIDEKKSNNFISKVKDNLCNLFNLDKKVTIDTKDISAPDNINKIDIKILEDNAIINFDVPKDNGTDYEYIIEDEDREEKLNLHSESGIYGYSYKISNNENNMADKVANKLDNSPIVLQNINWNQNYYLHIRTIDKSNNTSENKTIKIDLPSLGVKVEYVDKNTGAHLSMSEKMTGNINDNYDAKKKLKEIQDYTLVDTVGEAEGKLKRELTTIKFEYAQNATLSIKYIDEETKQEISKNNEMSGYIGKTVDVKPIKVESYIPNDISKNIKMTNVENEIVFTYKKVQTKVEDKNKEQNQMALTENNKVQENENILQEDNANNNNKKNISIRYVDINTNKLLFEDKVVVGEEKQMKYKLKKIEGYNLVNNMYDNSDNKDKRGKSNYDMQESKTNIMDEIIDSLDIDASIKNDTNDGLSETEKRRMIAQYEIVMNCDESDYIIYYKK